MIIYSSVFFFNILVNFVFKKHFFLKVLFLFFIIAILGFRSPDVGVDTINYYYSFGLIKVGVYEVKDLLYFLVSKILIFFGFGPELLVFIFSVLTIIPLAVVIYQDSPYPVLSFAIILAFGFYAAYFNLMRQGAAMSLGLLYIYYLLHDKRNIAFFSLFAAFLMHASSIILLPIFFIVKVPAKHKLYAVVLLWILSIVSAFNSSFFYGLLNSVSFLVPARFLSYIEPGEQVDRGLSFVFNQIFFFMLLYSYFKVRGVGRDYIYLGSVGIVLLYLFSGVKYVDRLAYYYYMVCVIAIPIAIYKLRSKRDRVIVSLVLLLSLFVLFVYRTSVDPHKIFPYTTIFN